jgi:hypothetical protein
MMPEEFISALGETNASSNALIVKSPIVIEENKKSTLESISKTS